MIDKTSVAAWLQAYIQAWKSYDEKAIGELFSEDAVYMPNPFYKPIRGRNAITAYWLEKPDQKGTYDAEYEPLLIEGNRAVTHGRSRYFEPDGKTLKFEWDNIFVLQFDEQGRCNEYREWSEAEKEYRPG
jgi:ketosteroid isomerase-like protein